MAMLFIMSIINWLVLVEVLRLLFLEYRHRNWTHELVSRTTIVCISKLDLWHVWQVCIVFYDEHVVLKRNNSPYTQKPERNN